MSDGKQLRVIYDAECTVGQGARSWVDRRDGKGIFRFEPADKDIPADERMLTVQDCEGSRHGFDGWVEILKHLPRWRRLAPVLAWKPIRYMGSAIYTVVAAHRQRFVRPD